MNKRCTKCKQSKPIEDFEKEPRNNDGHTSWCKACRREDVRRYRSTVEGAQKNRDSSNAYYVKNIESGRKKSLLYYAAHREELLPKMRERRLKRYKEDAEYQSTCKAYSAEWRKNNIARSNATDRLKQLRKRRATPKWLSPIQKAQLQEFYEVSLARSVQTGVKHHVDHIFALKGRGWRGLHVPWNLRVMVGKENNQKTNKPPREFLHMFWGAA